MRVTLKGQNPPTRPLICGGHAILLSRDDATMQAAIDAVSAFPGGLQVGGGVTPDSAVRRGAG